jgi:hypothetical protein
MKTFSRFTVVLALVAIAWTALGAQDQAKPKSKSSKPAAESAMPVPKPSPEMTKLIQKLRGTWSTAEKMEPSEMSPKGGSGRGTATFAPGPGNLSMTEKYNSRGAMGSFAGFGNFWWDAKSQAYKGVWCDSMTPDGCDSSGTTKWEGDNLVGMMESEMNGQKMVNKITYSDFKPNSFVMTMESGPDENSLKKMMTITYTKAGTASSPDKSGQ